MITLVPVNQCLLRLVRGAHPGLVASGRGSSADSEQ